MRRERIWNEARQVQMERREYEDDSAMTRQLEWTRELLLQFSQQNRRRIPVESWRPRWSRKVRKAAGIEANASQGRHVAECPWEPCGAP